MGKEKILFDIGSYGDRKESIENDAGEDYDEDKESPVSLSDEQEQDLFVDIQDILGNRKVLDGITIAKFRQCIPDIFRQFLNNKLNIPNHRMLEIAIECMDDVDDLDDFLFQVVHFPVFLDNEGLDEEQDFQAYVIHKYFVFELQEIEKEREANQQRIYVLLKDKAEREIELNMPNYGIKKNSKRHKDNVFDVCQFLFQTADVLDVLSRTKLNTADKSLIDAIISFLFTNPLKKIMPNA